MKEDYSLAAMERAMVAANKGKPLTAKQAAEVKTFHEKIAAAEKALHDAMAKLDQPRQYGANNRVVTLDRYELVRARLREKFARMNVKPPTIYRRVYDFLARVIKMIRSV